MKTNRAILASLLLSSSLLAADLNAQTVLFFDDFSGPTLNPIWEPSVPALPPVTYLGAPNYAFETLGTDSVLRMSNFMSDRQKRGWSTSSNFFARQFHLEARFNTLTQSDQTSLDGFMQIYIIDAADPSNRFEVAGLLGADFGPIRSFEVFSSIGTNYFTPAFPYADNTFYRLVIEGSRTQNIRAALVSESGQELISYTLPHNTSEFASGFKIGLSQTAGIPGRAVPLDVAVDSVRLTTTDTLTLSIQVASVQICWESLPNRTYQVQYRSTLTTNLWTDLGAAVQGNGTTNCVTDGIGGPTRFYQVVTLP